MYTPLNQAKSFSTGITFYSTSNKKYVTMATIDEHQNIETKCLSEKKATKEIEEINTHFETKASNSAINIATFIILILALITIIYFLDTNHSLEFLRIFDGIIIQSFLIISSIVINIAALVSTFFSVEVRKFHAAEHMIVNAYRKLHRVPSIEELRKYSRFNSLCGTNLSLAILFFCIPYLIGYFFKLDYSLYAMIIIILELSLPLGLFNFVQVFVTKKPTDKELNVAIEGLKAWIENEQKAENEENNFS